ncbi:hypothetical protein GA0074692_4161 [Micromonospora pallida]|uniref:Uncharacterized protein n=1 Tax=Micromonospora pallida TaxID=145854 RepID=A0A1C6T2D2_9ACTN|nr:hypothetical protein [Micromonospora pallida]SCL35703.1 hypothetical protein GA0074692_4161 [Micromonospora pallida]
MSESAPRGGASIDDLLRFEEEPAGQPEARRRGGWLRWLLRTALVTGAATAVLVAVLRAIGFTVSLPVLVAGVLALLGVRTVTGRLAPPPPSRRGTSVTGAAEPPPAGDALRVAVDGWALPLEWATSQPERFTQVVLPRITELADERLRQRHGVTRDSDPARAQALLGERLWTFLAAPGRRPPSPRDLAAIVAELEKI